MTHDWNQSPSYWINAEAEFLQRHGAKKWIASFIPKQAEGRQGFLPKRDEGKASVPLNDSSIRELDASRKGWCQADATEHGIRDPCPCGPGIDEQL